MFIVQALDPYDDMGEKWETFKTESAANVYGRSHYGINNYIVVPTEVRSDGIYSKQAA